MSSKDQFLTNLDESEEEEEGHTSTQHRVPPAPDQGIPSLTSPRQSSRVAMTSHSDSTESSRKRVSFSNLTSHSRSAQGQQINDSSSSSMEYQAPQGKGFLSLLPSRTKASLDDNISKQGVLRRKSGESSAPVTFAKRSIPYASKKAGSSSYNSAVAAAVATEQDKALATYRRYRVGDSVLVCNTQSRWPNPVNKYGYPAGGGLTSEEMNGPYIYVLATVKKVHFEEDAEYYTVTRADTGLDQRADAEWMEPLRTTRGQAAALRAATEALGMSHSDRGLPGSRSLGGGASGEQVERKWTDLLEATLCLPLVPFFWIAECFINVIGNRLYRLGKRMLVIVRRQGQLFLNGMQPYACAVRITFVNLLVVCSTWYMFIASARLTFFPPSSDYALAIVSNIVWIILTFELIFEVFIRPDGYRSLITSEKAYAPSTVRFINSFHLFFETISLVAFFPEFICLWSSVYTCGDRPPFSNFNAVFMSVLGPSQLNAFYGRAYIALDRLRVFGLVRHWKKMWINNKFVAVRRKSTKRGRWYRSVLPLKEGGSVAPSTEIGKKTDKFVEDQKGKEHSLIEASNIGTALMVTNSHRALMILCAIMGIFPLLYTTLNNNGGANPMSPQMTTYVQALNTEFIDATSEEECNFFVHSLVSWVVGLTEGWKPRLASSDSIYLLYLGVEPIRCNNFIPYYDGNVTTSICRYADNNPALFPTQEDKNRVEELCSVWRYTNSSTSLTEMAEISNIRTGAIDVQQRSESGFLITAGGNISTTFRVNAQFNQRNSILPAAMASFLLQLCLLICVLGGLSMLRRDSEVLVLGPLRRMLKIVAQYAKNPLSSVKTGGKDDDSDDEEVSDFGGGRGSPEDRLGSYETEQLISAVSKITDLLRKCWGVAGADIISTNLATQEGALTEVFNPTVPGKSVYALFGFAAINGFDHILRQLGGEVMILINDVAAVLHGEVFRWGFGDSGQCNKNLGSAFLMVFRIGLVKEVIQKLEQATDVVFSSTASKKPGVRKRSRNNSKSDSSLSRTTRKRMGQRAANANKAAMSLSLQSLPGISAFTDRAVIGLLKSFAGIYRDNKLLSWKNDFRLGAGVGAFSVNMIFGLDAGWAVEGAVGSEYKIDATYLSPHVNMASRMMSACKQYGVSVLFSQAVQELMSDTAQSKLRHLDTVTVKGSTLKQKIYTYDARHKGVDFFLFSRSDEQADLDSDRYTPNIWNTDQDLTAMRQHVTEDFELEFNKGRDAYLSGDWPNALRHLDIANEIMVENVMDQGYIQDELNEIQNRILDGEDAHAAEEELRNETGDGPSRRLIAFMESEGKFAPETWKGYRPLTSK